MGATLRERGHDHAAHDEFDGRRRADLTRDGVCVCGVAIAAHFTRRNRKVSCAIARRRHASTVAPAAEVSPRKARREGSGEGGVR